ncbi:GCN5-related N-acetyltransferase [Sphingomonadaceae bacterium OTU29THOMA1]|nr:GCN5-related N-acetyltransferase [Sphingomonadaceae bacterium OTU29THOMA1]
MQDGAGPDRDRAALESEWLHLTRVVLPGLAGLRGWPIRADHCFQRVLLDVAVRGVWYDAVAERPAYRFIAIDLLRAAVALGRDVADGTQDLPALNRRSLASRRARKAG